MRHRKISRKADSAKAKFENSQSEHLTLLNVYNSWLDNQCSEEWATENFIQQKELLKALDIREQLVNIMMGQNVPSAQYTRT